jgi:MSHA biogenesis protein MshL
MKRLLCLSVLCSLAACTTPNAKNTTADAIRHEMNVAVQEPVAPSKPDAVSAALLPPLNINLPKVDGKALEAKFDLAVNNTPANQVFMAIVSGTRYSMLVHPEVSGNISLNLKDVTVFDALEAIREMYGYEYKIEGSRVYIQPIAMQTRIFQVNYLTGQRDGSSSLRVASGSVSDSTTTSASNNNATNANNNGARRSMDSSKVTTTSSADFWVDISTALKLIIGVDDKTSKDDKGRSLVVSPLSGVIVVRAMPNELKSVAAYLKASQISVERQVILEAKIVEVQLSDSYQTGVNWAGFGNIKTSPTTRASFGQLSPGVALSANATGGAATALSDALINGTAGTSLSSNITNAITNTASPGSLFGMAFQTNNFAALLNFLETQGNVHVLSSPRIATVNNQKAVLKVGTDEFFVTKVTGGSVTTATATTAGTATAPTIETTPFFSGIMLDVTPQIDEKNEIVLHVHPSVSQVSTVNKTINFGALIGTYNLPMPSSSVSETDSIVRARDGQIVAIGGLMRQATYDDQSGLPGLPKAAFGETNKRTEKRELVILIKPTVVDSDKDWSDDITRSRDRMNGMTH